MRYHLVGILGSSMSGLAEILKAQGHKVTGSDLALKGHNAKNITKDINKVVISAAITPQSPGWVEVEQAKKLKIPVLSRCKVLQQLMLEKYGVAVAGTHGKSTVAAMVGFILEKAGLNPTVLVGADLVNWQANFRVGKGRYFVVEACEWARQFLLLRPKAAIVTNVEEEHLDTYPKGMPQVIQAFKKFVKLLPKSGLLVANADDKNILKIIKSSPCKVKFFTKAQIWPGLKLSILGKFNLLNATAAARLCHEVGVSSQIIKEALNDFKGIKRRLEIKGTKNGILVLDDYAHHPTEIKTTLAAVKEEFPERKLFCVFQPHQYLRTKLLFRQFAKSFQEVNTLILADIFQVPGRDEASEKENKLLVSNLACEIEKTGVKVVQISNFEQILKFLKTEVKKSDLILTMGATKIYQIGEKFIARHAQKDVRSTGAVACGDLPVR